MEYKLKRGFKPEIGRIKEVLELHFPVSVIEVDGKLTASYGALKLIEARITDNKLFIETDSNPDASDEEIIETNSKFRKFLDDATGYSLKQRVKKAKKEVMD